MKFRFIRVSIMDGNVYGSNDELKMRVYSGSEDDFVVDLQDGTWMMADGEKKEIKEDTTPFDPSEYNEDGSYRGEGDSDD